MKTRTLVWAFRSHPAEKVSKVIAIRHDITHWLCGRVVVVVVFIAIVMIGVAMGVQT